jgi:hypothetical protein
MTIKAGMMASPGGESPTGVFEAIRTPIQAGDTNMGGAGGIGAANPVVGIASITHATPAIATAAELLEGNENGTRLRSRSPETSRDLSDWKSLVLATGPGNLPAVRVRTAKTVQFGSRQVQKPNPQLLGGPNPDPYPSTSVF